MISRNLTWNEITPVLNNERVKEGKKPRDESSHRKEYKNACKWMVYERNKFEVGVNTRILCISDLHVPYQLPLSTFSDYAGRVDILMINGDVMDCQALSRFPKMYRVSPMEELIECRQYLIDLIEMISPKKVVITFGNHDVRFQSYFAKNLDNDILELMPETALDLICDDGFNHYDKRLRTKVHYDSLVEVFDNSGIEIEYTQNWYTQIGDTIFCHPMAFKGGIMQTAKAANDFFKNEGFHFSSLIMSHTHRTGHYNISKTVVYEQGAACDTSKQHYINGRLTPSQKEGFMWIGQDKNGVLLREKTKIVELN